MKPFTLPIQEISYNTTGLQQIIDISPNKSGACQVECSPDAKYSLLGSISPTFTPKPLPEAQGITGPACFGAFSASPILQLNVENLGASGEIKVPFGFITDLMTVPRIILPFFNPLLPKYTKPAIIHDWLYDSKSGPTITRRKADRILLEAMEVLGVPKWQRYLIYVQVRLFAGRQYNTTVSEIY